MSGNSAWRRVQTAPIVSRRSVVASTVVTTRAPALCGLASVGRARTVGVLTRRVACSFLQEAELVLADLELVAVLQPAGLDPAAVQEGPVQAPLVLDEEGVVLVDEHGVLARHGDVVEEDVAIRRAADRRPLALRHEVLTGAAAAGADDERRALRAEVLERHESPLLRLLGRVAHRRLRAGLVLHEQGAAARAVVRSLRVLEPALGAVHMPHESQSLARAALWLGQRTRDCGEAGRVG